MENQLKWSILIFKLNYFVIVMFPENISLEMN